MIKLIMQKKFFYDYRSVSEDLDFKKTLQTPEQNSKIRVDINKLLNRIKIEKKNEYKHKVAFFCFGISLISFMGIFIIIVR